MIWPSESAGRLAKFVAVGVLATLVHWAVVVALVSQGHWPPLVANIGAWLVAVAVSFAGQHAWTYAGHGVPICAAVLRFALVSAAGFTINEAAYAGLLIWTNFDYDHLLAVVLAFTAFATYTAGRLWVFAADHSRAQPQRNAT